MEPTSQFPEYVVVRYECQLPTVRQPGISKALFPQRKLLDEPERARELAPGRGRFSMKRARETGASEMI